MSNDVSLLIPRTEEVTDYGQTTAGATSQFLRTGIPSGAKWSWLRAWFAPGASPTRHRSRLSLSGTPS